MFKLPVKVTRTIGKIMWKTKKASPEICLVSGLILGGTAFVIGIVNTWKNKDKLSNDIDKITEAKELVCEIPAEATEEEAANTVIVSVEEKRLAVRKAWFIFFKDTAHAYWLPFVLILSSGGLVLGGHRLLRKELSSLTAAYALLTDRFKKYRERVVLDQGVDKDREYMFGKNDEVVVTHDNGDGDLEVIKSPGYRSNISPYAFWFSEGIFDEKECRWKWRTKMWDQNKGKCIKNLRWIQNAANDRLTVQGWLKLNDVLRMLGAPLTATGEHVGWVKNSVVGGDGFVDFGVFPEFCGGKRQLPVNRSFLDLDSHQMSALLDFNVDGCIDYIFDDIYEYDTESEIVGDRRRKVFD
jgi:hypothetical protein